MKKMNKKGFTLVELLAVIVILAILMAIAATNIGPVIDNSRRSSMRTTAQMILSAVQTQLTASYELYPGTYEFSENILDRGGVSAPFGGTYQYHKDVTVEGETKIGTGVYRLKDNKTIDECASDINSYVVVDRDSTTSNYTYSICLSTTEPGTYLAGKRSDVDDTKNETIFYGRADTKNAHSNTNNDNNNNNGGTQNP